MEPSTVRLDELLAHAGWVRALAARLVRDPAAADDVTQEVWAYALRSPPKQRENLRGWLGAAVRSAVNSMRRGEARRRSREADAFVVREQLGPAEFVERAQLHRSLVEHVLALDEPYRALVLARWFEGLDVAEAARRLGLSARVAQLRLDTAHELLRQKLDCQSGGRAVWSLAFLQWTEPAGVSVAVGSSGVIAFGGIAVATKWIATGVAAIVVASLAWWLMPRTETSASGSASAKELAAKAPAPHAPAAAFDPIASVEAREAATVAANGEPKALSAEHKPRWLVRGRVSGAALSNPERTRLSASWLGPFVYPDHPEVLASRDGRFELDVSAIAERRLTTKEPSELELVAEHPQCLRGVIRIPFARAVLDPDDPFQLTNVLACDIVLDSAAVVSGRVIVPAEWKATPDGEGRPGSGVQVALFEAAENVPRNPLRVDQSNCDESGRFSLRANHAGEFTVVALAPGLHAESRATSVRLGNSTELEPIELGLGASISGSVLRAGRAVGAGVLVAADAQDTNLPRFESQHGWFDLLQSDGSLHPAHAWATTDAAGRYSIAGLEAVRYELHVGSEPGVRVSLGGRPRIERIVQAPQAGVDLGLLPPRIHLSLSVDGRPPGPGQLDDVTVMLVPLEADSRDMVELRLDRCRGEYGTIQVIPDTAYEFRASTGRFESLVAFVPALAMSEEREVRLELKSSASTSTLAVRLLGEFADSVRSARFAEVDSTTASGSDLRWKQFDRTESGVFVISDLGSGKHTLRVQPFLQRVGSAGAPYLGAEFEVDLAADQTLTREVQLVLGSRLRLSVKDERGGFLRATVELRDARGARLETEFYCITSTMHYGCGWYLCEQGVNDHPPLAAGQYQLTLSAEGFESEVRLLDLVQGETQTFDVVMRQR